jgi:FAD/FMN-containing dehydrogenase
MKSLLVLAVLLAASGATSCDLGEGYAKTYWGENLARLMKIKSAFDPKNIFRHTQSVPLLSV